MLTNTTVILLQFWGRMFSQTDALLRRYSNSNCILWDHICQFWSQQHVGHFCVKILKLTLTTNEAFLCTNPGHKFPTHRSKTERLWSVCTRVQEFGCYGFMWTKLRCKIKLILIEGGWKHERDLAGPGVYLPAQGVLLLKLFIFTYYIKVRLLLL